MELIVSSLIGAVIALIGHLAAELATRARPPKARNRPALSAFPLTSEPDRTRLRAWWAKHLPTPESNGYPRGRRPLAVRPSAAEESSRLTGTGS
jgi:hypothetical protein